MNANKNLQPINTPTLGKRTLLMSPIGVEKMGDAADRLTNPSMLRLENLDTDLLPPEAALRVSITEIRNDDANSYLPFFGQDRLRQAATALVTKSAGLQEDHYDWRKQCFISAGGLNGILNTLLALIEPGDEVVMTSPTYVGLINRIKLAGGIPKFIPLIPTKEGWRLDMGAIDSAVSARTKAFLMMSPSMPTGAVLNRDEWQSVCEACVQVNAWMIYDSAMERILFKGVEHLHPASFPDMAERTITVGAASKEYRMIGWRVGWVVCPISASEAISRVAISNVVCPVGIAQKAVVAAIESEDDGIATCTMTWQARHDYLIDELSPHAKTIPAQGGWSLLIDCTSLGMTGSQLSARLLERGIAATSMENWGLQNTENYLRLVFANEPLSRLAATASSFKAAL